MSGVLETADADLDSRIQELIERGLALYGGGDLEGAMSAWRHALALDNDNRRAADYVASVKRHFDVVDEQVLDDANVADADVELEIPFGLVTVGPRSEGGIDAYESFEVEAQGSAPKAASSEPEKSAASEFAEEIPTRVRNAASALEIDEGWSIEGDEATSGGVKNPLIEVRSDRPGESDTEFSDGEASRELEVEVVTAENNISEEIAESLSDPMLGALADVSAGLADLELPEPKAMEPASESELDDGDSGELEITITRDPIAVAESLEPVPELDSREAPQDYEPALELALDRGSELDLELDLTAPEPTPVEPKVDPNDKRTMLGFPTPPPPSYLTGDPDDSPQTPTVAEDDELGRATAEISPLELGEALSALKLDGASLELGRPGASSEKKSRAESLSDVDFDLGESSQPSQQTDAIPGFESKPYASVALLDDEPAEAGKPTEAEKVGDAKISFRDPSLVEVEPAGDDLEAQLAELEMELETGSRQVDWTRHQDSGSSSPKTNPLTAPEARPRPGGPELAPLAPRRARATPPSRAKPETAPPAAGLDSVRQAIAAVVDSQVNASESDEERTRRRIAGFLACAESELERGELASAAVAADMALSESPESALGQKLIHERSDLLVSAFRRFLGDQSCIVAVALPLHELAKHELDHRTAFLLSRVDGTLTIEDVLDVSGMARLESFRCLARLVLQGILEVR